MDLVSPCVPVCWRVVLFGGLGDEVDFGLDGGRPGGPRVDILQSGANRWPLDRLGRECAHNQILQGLAAPGLILFSGVLTT